MFVLTRKMLKNNGRLFRLLTPKPGNKVTLRT